MVWLAYLDPGTGSIVFQAIIGALLGATMAVKMYWAQFRGFVGRLAGRRADHGDDTE